jgi:hypothetical protein
MTDGVRAVMHPMQSPSLDSILHGAFSQTRPFKLRKGHNPMLSPRNRGDPTIQSPAGRFPTTCVGFRPVGGLFGGVSLRHRKTASPARARVWRAPGANFDAK